MLPTQYNDPVIRELEKMNQRGGRSLSLVDLIQAGTVSPELSSHLATLVMRGVSIASGAQIGGTGKTTLLASLLAFTPPDTDIITVSGEGPGDPERSVGPRDPRDPGTSNSDPDKSSRATIYLCHEVSPGHFYSYLWGRSLRRYFRLWNRDKRHLAFTIHADTPEEMTTQIINGETGLKKSDFLALDMLIFIRAISGYGRRVTAVFEKDTASAAHVPVIRYNRERDRFEKAAGSPFGAGDEELELLAFFWFLMKKNIRRIEEVRRVYLKEYFPDTAP
jgi:hypothetical protein